MRENAADHLSKAARVAISFAGLLILIVALEAISRPQYFGPRKTLLAAIAVTILLVCLVMSGVQRCIRLFGHNWQAYWFGLDGTYSIGIVRMAIAASVLLSMPWLVLPDYHAYLAAQAAEFYQPKGLLKLLGSAAPPAKFFESLKIIALISTWFAFFGFLSWISMLVSWVSSVILSALLFSFQPGWSHGFTPIQLAQLAFLFGCSGDSLSVDALIKRSLAKKSPRTRRTKPLSQWPILLAQWAIALMFANALWYKVASHNYSLDWALSDNFRHILAFQHYLVLGDLGPPSFLIEWIMADEWRYKGLALANLLCQGMPILACVFARRPGLRALFGSFFLVETIGLGIVMRAALWYTAWFPLFAVFVDWDRLFKWLRPRLELLRERLMATVYYDAECGLRNRTMRLMNALDWFQLVRYMPVQPLNDEEFPQGARRDRLLTEMGVKVNGQTRYGSSAHLTIFSRLPLTAMFARPCCLLHRFALLSSIGPALYRAVIVRRRGLLRGNGRACMVVLGGIESEGVIDDVGPDR